MNGDGGILDLVRAWGVVLESFPKGKLWILGDGSRARKVWDAISDHDMVYSAMMVGYFDDLDDIFQAADLYVHPVRKPVNCQCLFSAIAQQVCPLITDSSHEPLSIRNRAGVTTGDTVQILKNETGIVAPAGNPIALGEAITMALRNDEKRAWLSQQAERDFRNAIDIEIISNVFVRALSGIQQPQNASGAPLL